LATPFTFLTLTKNQYKYIQSKKNTYNAEITSVYEDMTTLCQMFCPEDLEREMSLLDKASSTNHPTNAGEGGEIKDDEGYEEKERGEEEEEEVEEDG
jgi:hypothetical protein